MLKQIILRPSGGARAISSVVKQGNRLFVGGAFLPLATDTGSVAGNASALAQRANMFPGSNNFAVFDLNTGNILDIAISTPGGVINSMAAISSNKIVIGGTFTGIQAISGATVASGNNSCLTVLNTDTMTFSPLPGWSKTPAVNGVFYPPSTPSIFKVKYDPVSDIVFVCGNFLFNTSWKDAVTGVLGWKASDLSIIPNIGFQWGPPVGGLASWVVNDLTFGNFSTPGPSGRGMWIATPYFGVGPVPTAFNITDPNNANIMGNVWIKYSSKPFRNIAYSSYGQELILVPESSPFQFGGSGQDYFLVPDPIIRVKAGGSAPGSWFPNGPTLPNSYPLRRPMPFSNPGIVDVRKIEIDDYENVTMIGGFKTFNNKLCVGYFKFNLSDPNFNIQSPLIDIRYQGQYSSGNQYGPWFAPFEFGGTCYESFTDGDKLHLFGIFPYYLGWDRNYNYTQSHIILNSDGTTNQNKFAFLS